MTIQAATRFAIIGVSVGYVMSTGSGYVFKWAIASSAVPRENLSMINDIYFHIERLFLYGGLLLFFLTLRSKQKQKERGKV